MRSFFTKFIILLLVLSVAHCQILSNQSKDGQVSTSTNNPQTTKDKKINAGEEEKIMITIPEETFSSNKRKSTTRDSLVAKNKFEKIFEQTLGEELNFAKIEIVEPCEPLKTNEKCLSVNPEQRSGQFDKYYFYLNSEHKVYAVTAFYNSRFGSQAECRTFIKEWEHYFNKFSFRKITSKNNKDQFAMVYEVAGEMIEVSMSCFNEKIRDINSTVSLNIVKKF